MRPNATTSMLWAMAWWKAGACCVLGAALAGGCDGADSPAEPTSEGDAGSAETGDETSAGTTGSGPDDSAGTTTASTDPTSDPTSAGPTSGSGSEGGEEGPPPADGWIEIGHGLDEFFAFEGELPLTMGPQGFMMFSLPLRGSDFPVSPDPYDFDHPDTPVLSVWADIDGVEPEHPSGHFVAYLDYPVPFAFSDDADIDYEFVSVWLVVPDTIDPQDLHGRDAVVHAELQCSDGQLLVDEHNLTVRDATNDPGPGKG